MTYALDHGIKPSESLLANYLETDSLIQSRSLRYAANRFHARGVGHPSESGGSRNPINVLSAREIYISVILYKYCP